MSITFPNVPNLPGVPQLARAALPTPGSLGVTIGGAALSAIFGLITGQNQWGIFDSSGNQVLQADSILELEHHPTSDISDFPVQGTATQPTSFATYNKVVLPFMIRVRMAIGSTLSARQQYLKNLDTAFQSINLYTITTPEKNYSYADILNYDIVRTTEGMRATGAYFLTEIDIFFKQVIPIQAQYSTTTLQNAANPSALPQSVTGGVQLQPISGSAITQAANASLANAFGAF